MNPTNELKKRTWMQFNNLLAMPAGAMLFLCLAAGDGPAQTYSILHTFGTNFMGLNPQAPLVQGPDGTLYGTAWTGGTANGGQVFKVNPDGSSYTVLKDFMGSDGAEPQAGLMLSGTTLYGTTANGGANGLGVVFAVNTDGSGFTLLKNFGGGDGAYPSGSLILSGATLYGTTGYGGSNGSGTVFSVNADGTGFATVYNFTALASYTGTNSDGATPVGSLVLSGTTLYGTTGYGGTSTDGTLFSVNVDGSGFTVLREFSGSDGSYPYGSLLLSGTTLYGTTYGGGSSDSGTVFSINTDGTGFTLIKEFSGDDGALPGGGSLALSGATLYGVTWSGGEWGNGTLFSVNTDGSGFSVLKVFNWADGANPNGGLVVSGNTLYGTTASGGTNNFGTVFKVKTDGSSYTVVTTFAAGDGVNPNSTLTLSGSTLYGTASAGGSSWNGTLFSVNLDGTGYTNFKDFNGSDGSSPDGSLILSGTTLYGTVFEGGSFGSGTIFSVNTDGTGFTNLYEFTATDLDSGTNIDGAGPSGSLVLVGGTLYGTTAYGGINSDGTVFSVGVDGSGFTVLREFSGSDGANPFGSLLLSGTTLYGTTAYGGSNGNGALFTVNTDGTGFATLYSFTAMDPGTGTNTDGGYPYGGLILSDATLYGTATGGGSSGVGTVFSVNTDGSVFTVLKTFSGADGANPNAGLILAGATLFGTTPSGGSAGQGTVFQVNTDGSEFAVLKDFSGDDGASPNPGLVLSGSTLYGVTISGGRFNNGVLFSLLLTPTVFVPPQNQTIEAGSTVDLSAQAGGAPPLDFQWFLNGTNLTSWNTNCDLELTNVGLSLSGEYILVANNVFGSVTSAPVMLNVIPAIPRRPVPAINLIAPPGSSLGLDYRDDLGPSANWTTMATMTLSNSSQFYCDASQPLPPQRFYRAWQSGSPDVVPSLSLPGFVPAITLTGNVGDALRVDYINQFGPTNAWVTLATVTLTNTSQLYFDTSVFGQPARLWRIVPVP